MNDLMKWFSGGDLRSDGPATEIADLIVNNRVLIHDLLEGLENSDPVIRGRTSDALEKIARRNPELIIPHLNLLFRAVNSDNPMMVSMHLAMLFGHILACDVDSDKVFTTLKILITNKSAFTRSWTVVSLCILARKHPKYKTQIIRRIESLKNDTSIAVQKRAFKALHILIASDSLFPKGWVKSLYLQYLQ